MNGQELCVDIHYHIDYQTGTVSLRPDIALDPDLDLTICYEYGP